eukprot:scpid69919/ scgid16136/ 
MGSGELGILLLLLLVFVFTCSGGCFLLVLQPRTVLRETCSTHIHKSPRAISPTPAVLGSGAGRRKHTSSAVVACNKLQYGLVALLLCLICVWSFLFTYAVIRGQCPWAKKKHSHGRLHGSPTNYAWILEDDFLTEDIEFPKRGPGVKTRQTTGACDRSSGISFCDSLSFSLDTLTMSHNSLESKLLRKCLRLHDHLENMLSRGMLSIDEYCTVVDECRENGNISGLVRLYGLLTASSREEEFLTSLRRHRSVLSLYHSSDETINLCRSPINHSLGLPRRQNPDLPLTHRDIPDIMSYLSRAEFATSGRDPKSQPDSHSWEEMQKQIWESYIACLEDLLVLKQLTVPQYSLLVDLQDQPEKQLFALKEIMRRSTDRGGE